MANQSHEGAGRPLVTPIEHKRTKRGGEVQTFYEAPSWCRVDMTTEVEPVLAGERSSLIGVLLADHRVVYSSSVLYHGTLLAEMGLDPESYERFALFNYTLINADIPDEPSITVYGNLDGPGLPEDPLELLNFLNGSLPESLDTARIVVAAKQTDLRNESRQLFEGTVAEAKALNISVDYNR